MKKHLLFILIFLCSFDYCYCQPKSHNENSQIKKELFDSIAKLNKRLNIIENKLRASDSVFANNLIILKKSIDSTKKNIDDSRLRESLKSADSTINKLDTMIDSFAVIYTVISIIIILLTVGLPIILQQLAIKPMKDEIKADHTNMISEIEKINELKISIREKQIDVEQKVHNSLQRIDSEKNEMFSQIKKEFDSKFLDYLNKNKQEIIDQALINLTSEKNEFQNKAINYIALTPYGDFSDEQLFRISRILREQKLDLDKSETLSNKLASMESVYSDDFFSSLPLLEKINSKNTRLDGYNYYAKFGISKHESQFVDLLLSEDPTQDYIELIDWFRSSHQTEIIAIINFEKLHENSLLNIKAVYEKLTTWCYFEKYKNEIEKSILYYKYLELTKV